MSALSSRRAPLLALGLPFGGLTADFTLHPGEALAIVGSSGSGKTRAAEILAGVRPPPSRARVSLGGIPLQSLAASEKARLLGFVPSNPAQLFSLLARTVVRELELAEEFLGQRSDRSRIENLLDRLALGPLALRHPMTLSGGERVRLALAVVLAKTPGLVVIDDVIANLDAASDRLIENVLAQERAERGMMVVEAFARPPGRIATSSSTACLFLTAEQTVQGSLATCWKRVSQTAPGLLPPLPRLACHLAKRLGVTYDQVPTTPDLVAERLTRPECRTSEHRQRSALPPGAGANHIEGLVFTYGSELFSLGPLDVDFKVQAITAIVGKNGAGKTTLLRCLGNLNPPTTGSVFLAGALRSNTEPLHVRAKSAAYVFQNPDDQLFLATARDELFFFARVLGVSNSEATKRGLMLADRLGFADHLESPPLSLPRSRRRLLTLASALAGQPSLLLLDEPTAGLDQQQTDTVGQVLREYASAGGTVVLVSHDLDMVAEIADQIAVLEAGRLCNMLRTGDAWPLADLPSVPAVAGKIHLNDIWNLRQFLAALGASTDFSAQPSSGQAGGSIYTLPED